MKYLLLSILLTANFKSDLIFDFNKSSNIDAWRVVDDGVMGGKSSGNFILNKEGHGLFSGNISLENNGGFSSVRYRFTKMNVTDSTKVILTIKGDGRNYQFRVQDKASNYYSYITMFNTSGNWETIEIPLNKLYPSFRGRRLNQPNFSSTGIEEITFLIANKKAENFALLLDKITLK